MNYYKNNGGYLESDLELDFEKVSKEEYQSWRDKLDNLNNLKKQLLALDDKSSRSMRAILAETATADDRAYLANLESQAADLRQQIHDLEVGK